MTKTREIALVTVEGSDTNSHYGTPVDTSETDVIAVYRRPIGSRVLDRVARRYEYRCAGLRYKRLMAIIGRY